MRKTILGALLSSAFAITGTAHAGLTLDLNGSLGGGVITADALDWAPTSFLAMGGNTAIANFQANTCGTTACNFDVLTHAKLTAYKPTGGGSFVGLPAFGGGEITMVARYTEKVVDYSLVGGTRPSASFESTGAGWLEFYWSSTADAADLTGSNFNNGTLIGRLSGVTAGAFGQFTITDLTAVALDGSNDGNQFPGQSTVSGTGSQGSLNAGTTSVDLDPLFFLTSISDFEIKYENISIGLPYSSVNPSDCFNPNQAAAVVSTTGLLTDCNTTHESGPYSSQNPLDPGYLPVVGAINGLGLTSPDFVAQTDYNSSVNGVPEPGTLTLVGFALAALGYAATRRRRT